MAAERRAVGDDAAIFHAVRPGEHEHHRQVADCPRRAVARQRLRMHGLAGPVDAAFRPGIDVERTGRRPAGHAAVGEIETRPRQVEENVILAILRRKRRRLQTALAARQAALEPRHAVTVGYGLAEYLVVARNQRQRHPANRSGAAERAREHRQAVLAVKGCQPDIGDDEPLRRLGLPVLAAFAHGLRGQDIDAGLALGHRLVDREACRHFLVQDVANIQLPLPDRLADLVANAVERITVELGQELRSGDHLRQRPVADAVEFEFRLVGVDGDNRNAAPRGARQHEIVAGKAQALGAVAHEEVERHRPLQHLADPGRQAGAQGEPVTLAMLQTVDADFPRIDHESLRRRAVERDEGCVVGVRQILGELHADARRLGIGVDGMLQDPESVAGARRGVGRAHIGRVCQFQARLVGLDRRPSVGQFFESLSHQLERQRTVGNGARGCVGVQRRRRRRFPQFSRFVGI